MALTKNIRCLDAVAQCCGQALQMHAQAMPQPLEPAHAQGVGHEPLPDCLPG